MRLFNPKRFQRFDDDIASIRTAPDAERKNNEEEPAEDGFRPKAKLQTFELDEESNNNNAEQPPSQHLNEEAMQPPSQPGIDASSSYRPDIDGLRAVAVIAVIIYHFRASSSLRRLPSTARTQAMGIAWARSGSAIGRDLTAISAYPDAAATRRGA